MKAVVFEKPGRLIFTDRPKPTLGRPTEALIKVSGVGICGTDLHIVQDPPAHPAKKNIILGHEFSGIIEEVGEEIHEFAPGEQVLIDPHPGCGVCSECRRSRPDCCINLYKSSPEPGHPNTIGIFSDGAMSEYVVVPRQSLYKISKDVPAQIAALAEPLACVLNATDKVKVQPSDYVVILGAGPIGLLFAMLLKSSGASKLIVSEPSEYRRKAALEAGVDFAVHPRKLEAILEDEMPEGADVVVEAVGPLLPLSIKIARAGGKVLQFGHDESVAPSISVGVLLKKELTVYGSFIGRYSFEKAARVMESNKLPLEKIISHKLSLSEVHKGIDILTSSMGLKIILTPT